MATVNEKMTAIADNIRSKTGGTEALSLDNMASGVNEVYEAGKKAEQNAFWEIYQEGGDRENWQYAFYYRWWTDDTYNPIYPIKVRNPNTNMFYRTPVTNTKVSIDIRGTTLNYTFREASIVTIPELIVDESTNVNQGFLGASDLKNITITGTIGTDFKISWCPLTVESIKSIISALCDYTDTENEYVNTVTFKTSAFETLEAEGATAEYNGTPCTWAELIDNKKWNLTLA